MNAITGTKLMHMAGRPTNRHTKDLREGTTASKRASDSLANPAFYVSLGSVTPETITGDFAYANDFPIAVEDINDITLL